MHTLSLENKQTLEPRTHPKPSSLPSSLYSDHHWVPSINSTRPILPSLAQMISSHRNDTPLPQFQDCPLLLSHRLTPTESSPMPARKIDKGNQCAFPC